MYLYWIHRVDHNGNIGPTIVGDTNSVEDSIEFISQTKQF